jgi:hypothetical protein
MVPEKFIIFNKLTQLIARECVTSRRIRKHGRQERLLVSWKTDENLVLSYLISIALSICSGFYSILCSDIRIINVANITAHFTKFPQLLTTSEGEYSDLTNSFADLLTNLH